MSTLTISKLPSLPVRPVAASGARLANADRLALEHAGYASGAKAQEADLKLKEEASKSKEFNKHLDLQKYALTELAGSIIGSATAGAGNTDIHASDNGRAPSDGKPVKASGEVGGSSSVQNAKATESGNAQNAAGAAAELGRQSFSIANLNPHPLSALLKQQ